MDALADRIVISPRGRSAVREEGKLRGASLLLALVLVAGCVAQPDTAARTDATPTAQAETAPMIATPVPLPEPTVVAGAEPKAESAGVVPDTKAASALDPNAGSAPAAPDRKAVPAAAPRISLTYRIEIPRLGINLPVAEGDVPRDVDRSQTPEHYAFHLPGTSMFESGNTYIYAHARIGMFLSLWQARVGDVVIVRTPLGTREYVVAEVHPRVPPLEVAWAGPTVDTRLTLQTSTGPNDNDPRFVVVARPR